MRWTKFPRSAGVSPAVRRASRPPLRHLISLPLFLSSVLLSGAPEKHLSVYSVAANYSLPLVQRDGHDYVGLLEVLEPLGRVSARTDGTRWHLRYYREEDDFQAGKTRCRIQGRDLDMPADTVQTSDEKALVSGPFFSDRDHQRYVLWWDRVSLGILGRESRGPLLCRHSSRFIEPPAKNSLGRFIVKK